MVLKRGNIVFVGECTHINFMGKAPDHQLYKNLLDGEAYDFNGSADENLSFKKDDLMALGGALVHY